MQQTTTTTNTLLARTSTLWKRLLETMKLRKTSLLSIQTRHSISNSMSETIRERHSSLSKTKNKSSGGIKILKALFLMINLLISMRWCRHRWKRSGSSTVCSQLAPLPTTSSDSLIAQVTYLQKMIWIRLVELTRVVTPVLAKALQATEIPTVSPSNKNGK